MKKIVFFALVFAVCGVLHNSVLAQELDERYLVTYWSSQRGLPIRSATFVTVVNQSDSTCAVQIEWLSDTGDRAGIIRPRVVFAGDAVHFCSRELSPPNVPTGGPICTAVSDPALTIGSINQGKAIVSSTAGFECSRIAVDARVYYTTGDFDGAISAISNPKVVFFGEANLGD